MSSSLHQSSVPGFIAMLKNIKGWLDKAAAEEGRSGADRSAAGA
jgi:hypothetical protein